MDTLGMGLNIDANERLVGSIKSTPTPGPLNSGSSCQYLSLVDHLQCLSGVAKHILRKHDNQVLVSGLTQR